MSQEAGKKGQLGRSRRNCRDIDQVAKEIITVKPHTSSINLLLWRKFLLLHLMTWSSTEENDGTSSAIGTSQSTITFEN